MAEKYGITDYLLGRLRFADEGSRVLDLDIALAIDHKATGGTPRWNSIREGVAQEGRNVFMSDSYGFLSQIPKFTRSLDVAMTLIPEGWHVIMLQQDTTGRWFCALHRNGHADQVHSQPFDMGNHQSATAAIAVCRAALEARRMSINTLGYRDKSKTRSVRPRRS